MALRGSLPKDGTGTGAPCPDRAAFADQLRRLEAIGREVQAELKLVSRAFRLKGSSEARDCSIIASDLKDTVNKLVEELREARRSEDACWGELHEVERVAEAKAVRLEEVTSAYSVLADHAEFLQEQIVSCEAETQTETAAARLAREECADLAESLRLAQEGLDSCEAESAAVSQLEMEETVMTRLVQDECAELTETLESVQDAHRLEGETWRSELHEVERVAETRQLEMQEATAAYAVLSDHTEFLQEELDSCDAQREAASHMEVEESATAQFMHQEYAELIQSLRSIQETHFEENLQEPGVNSVLSSVERWAAARGRTISDFRGRDPRFRASGVSRVVSEPATEASSASGDSSLRRFRRRPERGKEGLIHSLEGELHAYQGELENAQELISELMSDETGKKRSSNREALERMSLWHRRSTHLLSGWEENVANVRRMLQEMLPADSTGSTDSLDCSSMASDVMTRPHRGFSVFMTHSRSRSEHSGIIRTDSTSTVGPRRTGQRVLFKDEVESSARRHLSEASNASEVTFGAETSEVWMNGTPSEIARICSLGAIDEVT